MKAPGNVEGQYYVDEDCERCGRCVGIAPQNFTIGESSTFVSKQPENEEEISACEEAFDECPNAAIWDDGDMSEVQ